jgi:UDP-glucose 4-epimerase
MKKCAVIGSNGYIGRHLVWYLSQMGITADCYDVAEGNDRNYTQLDITSKDSVAKINLDVDYIFMFAGLTGTWAGFDKYQPFVNINEIGMLNLLDAIRNSEYRPKIIFPSSRLVYKGIDKPLKEDDQKDAKSIYAVNKLACEHYLEIYHQCFSIPYSVFRICVPYGNLLGKDYSFGTVGFFIKMASAGKDITLYGGGDIKRTFTHMEDLCYQVINGAFNRNSDGEVYNVGGETYSLRDAATVIASKYGVKVTSVDWPERDLKIESGDTYFDDCKIQKLLGGYQYKKLKELL